ncbi:membrane associated ring finger 1,8, putative [Ricinus communis]|uniref:Membrane associated ring finger 1,8, putative n=1 Tax=Ricinus communis TaxID=3988 RepID=B9T8D8_RICCO|nr:membrane associated ring finger 1,8, putative [Ricinus communis]
MGDHFVLLVDRLLTESTLEAAITSRNQLLQATESAVGETKIDISSKKVDFGDVSTPGKIVECRICQDEDEDSNMETPCSCCGSLKYAHRGCVQRWCNEKGNTMCEICHQQFKPGYTAPPPLFQIGRLPMNFRGNWESSRRDLNGPRFIAMVSTDHNFLNPDYEEEYSASTRNLICCRSVLIALLFLRTAGIILPIFVMVRAVTALQRRRFQQEPPNASFAAPEEETEQSTVQARPHTSNVHY